MSKWKLCRQAFGNDEFELKEGEVTIGRGVNNTIKLSSIVISRNHCIICINQDEVFITDLKSSNGVYVGIKKIAPNTKHPLNNNDVIGLGWASGALLGNIKDDEKHIYKLVKIVQPENNLKRKLDIRENIPDIIIIEQGQHSDVGSDASSVDRNKEHNQVKCEAKKIKLEPIDLTEDPKGDLQHDLLKNNQEYYIVNDEPEIILSDSDYETEHRLVRLSENLPMPIVKVERPDTSTVNSIYSQQDDDIQIELDEIEEENEAEVTDKGPNKEDVLQKDSTNKESIILNEIKETNNVDLIRTSKRPSIYTISQQFDQIDNNSNIQPTQIQKIYKHDDNKKSHDSEKLPKMITEGKSVNLTIKNIPIKLPDPMPNKTTNEKPSKGKETKSKRKKSDPPKKPKLTDTQKQRRREKLKEICHKEKAAVTIEPNTVSKIHEKEPNNIVINNTHQSKNSASLQETKQVNNRKNNKINCLPQPKNPIQMIEPHIMPPVKKRMAYNKTVKENTDIISNINMQKEHINESLAVVHPKKDLNSINIAKQSQRPLIDKPRSNLSLKRKALKKILEWHPNWLDEQKVTNEPPPIIEKEYILTLLSSYSDYKEYVRQMGNLLLIELWEYVTQEYNYQNEKKYLNLQIDRLPSKPLQGVDGHVIPDLYTITVKLLSSSSNPKHMPRNGDIMILKFSINDKRNPYKSKFCFVHNVDHIPSYNQKTFILSCYVSYSVLYEKVKPGDMLTGVKITNMNQQLSMFEAMEVLERSPIRNVILKPEKSHYVNEGKNYVDTKSQWTVKLNSSQLRAVMESVNAALNKTPVLRMIQGPPGTGKSSVICAIIMAYFYGNSMKKQNKRGKILICATSNAAVDELVIRLLNMRDTLEERERFRLVRVGRLESMHGRALDVCTQALAQKENTHHDVNKEIALHQANIDKWKAEKTDDPARAAYCEERIKDKTRQIELLRGRGLRPGQLLELERRLVEGADIVATTLASSVNHKMKGLRGVELCIVDEAGQAIEPETLLPLLIGVTKITLVGDPQQLPGYICSERAKTHRLDRSLLSRLSEYCECWDRPPYVLLDQQYRMHPTIADYPNRAFYGGRVGSSPPTPPAQLHLPPYCILDIPGNEHDEAWGAARVSLAVFSAARAHNPKLSVAVITPYVAHRDLLRKYLLELDQSASRLEVNTVDSFQGQERDVVVVSLGRREGVGFLAHAGRMNVLLTRARHMLIVCLYKKAVQVHEQWRTLVIDAEKKNFYKSLPSHMCNKATSSRQASSEEVLEFLRSKKN